MTRTALKFISEDGAWLVKDKRSHMVIGRVAWHPPAKQHVYWHTGTHPTSALLLREVLDFMHQLRVTVEIPE